MPSKKRARPRPRARMRPAQAPAVPVAVDAREVLVQALELLRRTGRLAASEEARLVAAYDAAEII